MMNRLLGAALGLAATLAAAGFLGRRAPAPPSDLRDAPASAPALPGWRPPAGGPVPVLAGPIGFAPAAAFLAPPDFKR